VDRKGAEWIGRGWSGSEGDGVDRKEAEYIGFGRGQRIIGTGAVIHPLVREQ